jgi:hypothetical protein
MQFGDIADPQAPALRAARRSAKPAVRPAPPCRTEWGTAIPRAVTGTPVYFCHRASAWQRGSNENMNGLLRDYFPKHTDLRGHNAEYLAAVADEINTGPRKTLTWPHAPSTEEQRRPRGLASGPDAGMQQRPSSPRDRPRWRQPGIGRRPRR